MGKIAGGFGLLFAIAGGYLIYNWMASTTHSETGAIGAFLDNAWLIALLFLGVIAVMGTIKLVKDIF